MKTGITQANLLRLLFYGGGIFAVVAVAIISPRFLLNWFQPATVGAGLVALFGALYVGELKQESVGQLYQALAAASLKTNELVYFHEAVLGKIRAIRRILLASNFVKLLGGLAALYLINEKPPATSSGVSIASAPPFAVGALTTALIAFGFSILLFVRLWFEVTNAEALLIEARESTILQQRSSAFLAESKASIPHDFDSDPVAKSFRKKPVKGKLRMLS